MATMRTDEYTGVKYDADRYYRGALGIWHDKEAEKAFYERKSRRDAERRARRDANRKERGKPRRSPSSLTRSADRYGEYLRSDCGMSFKEWLHCKESERKDLGRTY